MNQKIPFHELAKKISGTTSISEESAEVFIKNFFDLLGEVVVDGELKSKVSVHSLFLLLMESE